MMTHDEIMAHLHKWEREYCPFPRDWNKERLVCYQNDIESAFLRGFGLGQKDVLTNMHRRKNEEFEVGTVEATAKWLLIRYEAGELDLKGLLSHLHLMWEYREENEKIVEERRKKKEVTKTEQESRPEPEQGKRVGHLVQLSLFD